MTAGCDDADRGITEILGLRTPAGLTVGAALWCFLTVLGTASGTVTVPAVYLGGFGLLGVGWWLLLRSPGDVISAPRAAVIGVTGAVAGPLAVLSVDDQARAAILALGA